MTWKQEKSWKNQCAMEMPENEEQFTVKTKIIYLKFLRATSSHPSSWTLELIDKQWSSLRIKDLFKVPILKPNESQFSYQEYFSINIRGFRSGRSSWRIKVRSMLLNMLIMWQYFGNTHIHTRSSRHKCLFIKRE